MEFATEPLSLAYGIPIPDTAITNTLVSPWSVQLLDWYGNVAAGADNYTCAVVIDGAHLIVLLRRQILSLTLRGSAGASNSTSLATAFVILHGNAVAINGQCARHGDVACALILHSCAQGLLPTPSL